MVKTLRGRKRGRNPLDEILETVRVHIDGEPSIHEEGAGYMVARILKEQKAKIEELEAELATVRAERIILPETGAFKKMPGMKKTPLRMPVTTDADELSAEDVKKLQKTSRRKKPVEETKPPAKKKPVKKKAKTKKKKK